VSGFDECEADHLRGMEVSIDPHDVAPEGMAYEDVRAVLGGRERGMELRRERAAVPGPRARIAPAQPRTVVGAGAARLGERLLHVEPRERGSSHACFDHDRRSAFSPAIDVEAVSAHVD
jgi:hypothetical protein